MTKIPYYIGTFFFGAGILILFLYLIGVVEYDKDTLIRFKEKDKLLEIFPEDFGSAELNIEDLEKDNTPLPNPESGKIKRSPTYEEHMNKAEKLAINGYPNLAINEYKNAALIEKDAVEPYLSIGDLYVDTKEYDQALTYYNAGQEIDPNNVEILIRIGRTYLDKREITQAQQFFNTLPDTHEEVVYYKAIIAAYFQDYQTSVNLLSQLQTAQNQELKTKVDNFLNAYNEYNLTTESPAVHLQALLARSYIQTQEYEMAVPLLYDALREQEDYRELWILLGYSYLELEDYVDSVEALEEAKNLNPDKPETLFYLGLAYFGQDNIDKAVANVKTAIELGYEPKIQAKQKLAEFYYWQEDYVQAVLTYEEVLNENPENIDYFIRPVYLYLEILNESDKGLELGEKAVLNHPDNAMAYNLLGWALIKKNDIKEAEKNIGKALEIDPDLSAGYLNMGQINELEGDLEAAKENYTKAHEIGNGNSISNIAAQKYNDLILKEKKLEQEKVEKS